MAAVRRCMQCKRRYRNQADWNVVYVQGREQGTLCPSCQTPEENAEAEHNLATGKSTGIVGSDARRLDGMTLEEINRRAVERDHVAAVDGYFADHGAHVGVLVGSGGDECLVAWCPVDDSPALDFVDTADGEIPIVSQGSCGDGLVFVEAKIVEWMEWPRCFVSDDGSLQQTAVAAWTAFFQREREAREGEA